MPDASLAEKLKNWRLLSEGLKLRIEEVPFLKEDHTELSALVQQIDSLMQQTDVHEGRLREAIRQNASAATSCAHRTRSRHRLRDGLGCPRQRRASGAAHDSSGVMGAQGRHWTAAD